MVLTLSYLIIPGFYDSAQMNAMQSQARKLLDEFKIEGHPMVGCHLVGV
jgi:hypothetical protein